MIVVLDTNVIVSSLLSAGGPPADIIRRWEADEFQLAISPPLLSELERVLKYPRVRERYQKHREMPIALLKRLRTVVTLVDLQLALEVIDEDPADNRVLECAVEAGAEYIITGDIHLLIDTSHKHRPNGVEAISIEEGTLKGSVRQVILKPIG